METWKTQFDFYLEKYNRLLKIFSANVLMRGGVVLINLFTGFVMRRELGEAQSGLYGLFISSLVLFATFLNFGFNGSAIYYAGKKPEKLHLYLTTCFIITAFSIIVIIMSLVGFGYFFQFQSDSLRIVFVICYAIYSFSLVYRSFLMGLDENLFMQQVDLATRLAYLIFIGICYYLECISILGITIFMTLEYLVFTIVAHKKSQLNIWPLQWDMGFFKENILFNSKAYIAGILYMLLLKADQFIIKAIYNNHQVGVYGIGGTIVENLFMITVIICIMYLPKILANENLIAILDKSKKVLLVIVAISMSMALIIYVMSPWLYLWYFKKHNPEGVNCLRILLIGFITLSIFIFNYYIYFSIRLKKSLLIILGLGVILNLGLNFIYLPQHGIIASAWASSISYSLVAILSVIDLFYLKRRNFINKKLEFDAEQI